MTTTAVTALTPVKKFNFTLEDLAYYVVKRSDGTVIKTTIVDEVITRPAGAGYTPSTGTSYGNYTRLADLCEHTPKLTTPIFDDGKLQLYVADVAGAKKTWPIFDWVVDCADDVRPSYKKPVLSYDGELVDLLEQFDERAEPQPDTRVLKIDWIDRAAPELAPEFWVELNKKLSGSVMTCCIGGHGRSGSAAVALMMVNTDYTAKEAIIHLRSQHCPRAIESLVQHQYLNRLSKYLGRAEDALEVEKITDYRKAFEEMKTAGRVKGYKAPVTETVTDNNLSKKD